MDIFYVQFLSQCSQGVLKFDGSVMLRGTIIVDVFYRLCSVSVISSLHRTFDRYGSLVLLSFVFNTGCLTTLGHNCRR